VRRRAIIAGATAAIASPTASRGQAAPAVIGFLRSTPAAGYDDIVAAFRAGLAENGLAEGRDVAVEFRWADNRLERLPGLASELVARRVAVIVGNSPAVRAARGATTRIPIVFVVGEDPIRLGLVSSLTRPGGNMTGVAFLDSEIAAKRFGLLHEMLPPLATMTVLTDPTAPGNDTELRAVEEASRSAGRRILVARATGDAEIAEAFEAASRVGAQAMFVGVGPIYYSGRKQLIALAARHRLPTVYGLRSFVDDGGLLSYGPSLADAYRRAGGYVARILRGAKPGDLPVEMPTRYELVINLAAAKSIGFAVPPSLLAIADEVIE
jgi:putative ABC transport system substrate-binding protein